MFILPKVQCAVTVGHCQMQLGVGGALSPRVGPAQSHHGGLGAKPLAALRIFHFTVPKETEKNTPMV